MKHACLAWDLVRISACHPIGECKISDSDEDEHFATECPYLQLFNNDEESQENVSENKTKNGEENFKIQFNLGRFSVLDSHMGWKSSGYSIKPGLTLFLGVQRRMRKTMRKRLYQRTKSLTSRILPFRSADDGNGSRLCFFLMVVLSSAFLKRWALMGLFWNVFANFIKFVPLVFACFLWIRTHRFGSGFKTFCWIVSRPLSSSWSRLACDGLEYQNFQLNF